MADPGFSLVDALRKMRYGSDYADQTFSSPEDKALALASGAGANASHVLGNAAEDIVNTYAPRDPADRQAAGPGFGQSLGDQASEAARKNPGAAVTGNLAVTAPLRTAATLAAGPASLPAEALLQGALGGAEGAYAAPEGGRLAGAARGAATSAALPLAAGAARSLGTALANMPPPAGGAAAEVPAAAGAGPASEATSAPRVQSRGGGPTKSALSDMPPPKKAMRPASTPEAEAAGATKIPKHGKTFNKAEYAAPPEGYEPKVEMEHKPSRAVSPEDDAAAKKWYDAEQQRKIDEWAAQGGDTF